MGWIRKKAKQIGKGIKSVFKGVGKAFNKVFGGLFKKLGPIGSIALMFFLPGIGQLFSEGLSFIQTGISNLGTTGWQNAVKKVGETIFGQAGSVTGATSTLAGGKRTSRKCRCCTQYSYRSC
mgnify:CR=1 FL=1